MTWNVQKGMNKRKIYMGKGESKEVACRRRKERIDGIKEERFRLLCPLTYSAPSTHVKPLRMLSWSCPLQVRLWTADNSEAGQGVKPESRQQSQRPEG